METREVQEYFKNLIDKKQMYHTTILACANQEQVESISNELCRMLICKNNATTNDACELCLRFEKNILLNLIKIGDGLSQIKKEQMTELITKFSTSTFENSTKKVYVIQNIENLNEAAANAILKFLEEPEKEVYAILLTNDRSQIMQTIKSRCQTITIKEELFESEIDEELVQVICNKKAAELLLLAESFKKKSKKEQIDTLNYLYHNEIMKNQPKLAKFFLDVIIEIKNSNYLNLIIENFFIQIYEVISCA